jgi:hypothetical protein
MLRDSLNHARAGVEPGPPDCESGALTIRPCRISNLSVFHPKSVDQLNSRMTIKLGHLSFGMTSDRVFASGL